VLAKHLFGVDADSTTDSVGVAIVWPHSFIVLSDTFACFLSLIHARQILLLTRMFRSKNLFLEHTMVIMLSIDNWLLFSVCYMYRRSHECFLLHDLLASGLITQ